VGQFVTIHGFVPVVQILFQEGYLIHRTAKK
jgi:hypothetical protein